MITAENPGVILDNKLSFSANVSKAILSCRLLFYNIRRIWAFISMEATGVLVQSLAISRLEYYKCVAMLLGNTF